MSEHCSASCSHCPLVQPFRNVFMNLIFIVRHRHTAPNIQHQNQQFPASRWWCFIKVLPHRWHCAFCQVEPEWPATRVSYKVKIYIFYTLLTGPLKSNRIWIRWKQLITLVWFFLGFIFNICKRFPVNMIIQPSQWSQKEAKNVQWWKKCIHIDILIFIESNFNTVILSHHTIT